MNNSVKPCKVEQQFPVQINRVVWVESISCMIILLANQCVLIATYIATKLPWINPQIKKKMKLRKCQYDRAKQTGNYTGWCDFKQGRNEVNVLLETVHRNYCSNLFSDSSTSKKRFWSYIKTKGRITLHSRIENMFIPMRSIRHVF